MKKFFKQVIFCVIPDEKDQSASKIAQCLQQLGVKKIGDLSFVEEKDLSTHLSPKQSKELTNAFKEIGSNRSIFGEDEQPKKLTEIQARRITRALSNMKQYKEPEDGKLFEPRNVIKFFKRNCQPNFHYDQS